MISKQQLLFQVSLRFLLSSTSLAGLTWLAIHFVR